MGSQMNETNTVSGSPDSSKRERGMNRIWASLHPRQVIWVLLVALIAVLGWNGNGYVERLETVEEHIEIQNGTLQRMEVEQQSQKVHIEWIRDTLEKKHP